VVELVAAEKRGLGGRNQQLVLAALEALMAAEPPHSPKAARTNPLQGMALLSGGTDGEDGPTDAAGAWIDAEVVQRMIDKGLAPTDFLQRNDAYHFFEPLQALLRTGPTHTNVCDLRVLVVSRAAA
jgi:hydroxypyruvate reductase